MFDKAFRLLSKIKELEDGSTAYIVGGAVRDYLLGADCHDIDIATSVNIDIIEKHFPTHDIGKNKNFGILVIKFEDEVFEVANYRTDGNYTDGRRPDDVKIVSSFKEDSDRRDFTINAMAMDENHNIIDYHGGQGDLKNGVIRTVGDPTKRFKEDYLRIIRAIRFSAKYGFSIDYATECAIKYYSKDIMQSVSHERIWDELIKLANTDAFSIGIKIMKDVGVLAHILPEIDCMDTYPHYKHQHPEGDVWQHTYGVMRQLDNKSPIIKLAGLFHDIGKPKAYKWYPEKGKYHYINHDIMGIDVFDIVAERFRISKDIANEIRYCIGGHMKMHVFLKMKDSKCIKLMDSPYWKSLYDVSVADDRSRLYLYDWHFWKHMDDKIERLQVILDKKNEVRNIIDGHFIMDTLGVKGGKIVGDVLSKTHAYIIDKNIDVKTEEGINKIKRYVHSHK